MSAIPPVEDFEAFEAATVELLKPPFRSKFGAIPWAQRRRPRKRLEYLVEDWLTTTGVSVLGGRSSCGKSFLALHLSLSVARNKDFFGMAVKQCGVVYQAGEGGLGLLDRQEAYAKHFEMSEDEDIPYVLLPGTLDILTKEKKDVDDFIAECQHHSAEMEREHGFPAGLIIIDTLKKAAPGIDEISGKDYAVVVTNVYRIARETDCHVVLVHHTNADGKKLRGNTAIRDDVDQVILIEHDKTTGIRDTVLDKIKDGEDGKRFKFSLLSVPVRTVTMSDGGTKDITSCAVVSVSEKERLKKEQERMGFSVSPSEREIIERLFEAQDKYGKFIASESDGPSAAIGRTVVDFRYYLDVCVEKMVEVDDQTKARDRAKKAFSRNSRFIQNRVIETSRPYVWWNGKPIRGFPRSFAKGQSQEFFGTEAGQNRDEPISPGEQDMANDPGALL